MNNNDEEMIRLLKLLHEKLHLAVDNKQRDCIINLPPSLSTDEAMVLWGKAQDAGYVDDNYQPLISRTLSAVLAYRMAKHLSIEHKWKVFGELWNRKYMYHDYYEALNQKKSLEFQDELKKIFI